MVTLDDVLDGLEAEVETSGCPVATAPRVADHVDQTRRKTLDDLRLLERNGDVESHQFGERMVVWWPADDGSVTRDASESTPEPSAPDAAPEVTDTERRGAGAEPPPAQIDESLSANTRRESAAQNAAEQRSELADDVYAYLEDKDAPPKTTHGRNAIVDVFDALREHETLSTGDLKSEVYPGYTDHWGSAKVMWEGLSRYFDNVPGIEKGGYGEWTYTSDEDVQKVLRQHEHKRL